MLDKFKGLLFPHRISTQDKFMFFPLFLLSPLIIYDWFRSRDTVYFCEVTSDMDGYGMCVCVCVCVYVCVCICVCVYVCVSKFSSVGEEKSICTYPAGKYQLFG